MPEANQHMRNTSGAGQQQFDMTSQLWTLSDSVQQSPTSLQDDQQQRAPNPRTSSNRLSSSVLDGGSPHGVSHPQQRPYIIQTPSGPLDDPCFGYDEQQNKQRDASKSRETSPTDLDGKVAYIPPYDDYRHAPSSPWPFVGFPPSSSLEDSFAGHSSDARRLNIANPPNKQATGAGGFTNGSSVNSALDMHRFGLESLRSQAHERFESWAASQKNLYGNVDETRAIAHQAADWTQSQTTIGATSMHPLYTQRNGEQDVDPRMIRTMQASKSNTFISSTMRSPSLDALSTYRSQIAQQHKSASIGSIAGLQSFLQPSPDIVEQEFSVFVGDLCPDLREEDLVRQFLHPPQWPSSHPVAIALSNAQQAQGFYGALSKAAPAPFLTTKSATVMTDPLTGASRGFGFVRFRSEADCARALMEMQGVIIQPMIGHGGRPLRVCPATPKNRSSANASVNASAFTFNNFATHEQQFGQYSAQDLTLAKSSAAGYTPPLGDSSSPIATSSNESLASISSSAQDPNNSTVFVGGLSSLISEGTLKTFFVPFGEIKYVKIPAGKGCGFVQFVQKSDAERAIERMQGFPIGGGRIRLSWGRSQGDKAAAAAAYSAAQAAQIGRLAGLAGLNASDTSQIAAAALNGMASSQYGTGDAHAFFAQRLAAAGQANGLSAYEGASGHQSNEQHGDAYGHAPPSDSDSLRQHIIASESACAQQMLERQRQLRVSPPAYDTSAWSDQEREEMRQRMRKSSDEVLSGMFSGLSFDAFSGHADSVRNGFASPSHETNGSFAPTIGQAPKQPSDGHAPATPDNKRTMDIHSSFAEQSAYFTAASALSPSFSSIRRQSPPVESTRYKSFSDSFSPFDNDFSPLADRQSRERQDLATTHLRSPTSSIARE